MTGGDRLVRALARRGVGFVTTLSGNGLNPFYLAGRRAGLRLVDFRNEQAAAFAADAAARLTGQLAVCAVSSGIAHVNALAGVLNAWYDGAPVLLITGASEHTRHGQGSFQDVDQVALAAPLCKYAALVDRADRIEWHVHEACARAVAGRPGPVHLTIPVDVLAAEGPETPELPAKLARVEPSGAPDLAALIAAADLLARAERPVVVAGSGVGYARAGAELADFAAALDAPIVVPIWDRGAVDDPTRFLGVVGAASGEPRLLPDADLVVLAGARIDYRLGYGEPPTLSAGARLIRIDADPLELAQGRAADVAILADPRAALAALAAEIRRRQVPPRAAWLREARRRDVEFRRHWQTADLDRQPPTGLDLVAALRPLLAGPDAPLFLVDGGNIGQWAHVALADRYPATWLTCGASGVVGWGLGGAIGAKLACPERGVVLLSGDGAFGFTIADLETAVRHATPFVVVLADDRAWGIVVSGQERQYGADGVIASRLGPVRYADVAADFGCAAVRVERAADVGPAVAAGLASGRPTLVHVPLAPGGPSDDLTVEVLGR